jgi:hypothetical protein
MKEMLLKTIKVIRKRYFAFRPESLARATAHGHSSVAQLLTRTLTPCYPWHARTRSVLAWPNTAAALDLAARCSVPVPRPQPGPRLRNFAPAWAEFSPYDRGRSFSSDGHPCSSAEENGATAAPLETLNRISSSPFRLSLAAPCSLRCVARGGATAISSEAMLPPEQVPASSPPLSSLFLFLSHSAS